MKLILHIIVLSILLLSSSLSAQEHNDIVQIITPYGEMLLSLSDETPNHKAAFLKMAAEGYWDGMIFNRVIDGFVIQGGCPDTPEGFVDSPYLLDAEFTKNQKHVYGALGAGRDMNPEKRSATCQFYIVHRKEGLPRLDGDYTIFGQVIEGLDVLDMIATVPTDSLDAPLKSVSMDINIINSGLK